GDFTAKFLVQTGLQHANDRQCRAYRKAAHAGLTLLLRLTRLQYALDGAVEEHLYRLVLADLLGDSDLPVGVDRVAHGHFLFCAMPGRLSKVWVRRSLVASN